MQPTLIKCHFEKGGKSIGGQRSKLALLDDAYHLSYFCQQSASVMGRLEDLHLHGQVQSGVSGEAPGSHIANIPPTVSSRSQHWVCRSAPGVQRRLSHQPPTLCPSCPLSNFLGLDSASQQFKKSQSLTRTLRISAKTVQPFTFRWFREMDSGLRWE